MHWKARRPGTAKVRSFCSPAITSGLFALVLALSCVFLGSGPASADSCKGSACTGLNPAAMGCDDDARVLEELTETGLSLSFLYSPECAASWAYLTLSPSESLWPQSLNIFYVPQLGGSEQSFSTGYVDPDDVAKPSAMVGGNVLAKGCTTEMGEGFDPSPESWQDGTAGECTQWH
ncbi:DUF2690 domain-containing protein [Streptomyces sp. NPDC059894]|uniref:DUF2690 domain-containing protein n=1 Tax=unclassified Streptomyces TaxID=2593676 RepID=UPI00364FF615